MDFHIPMLICELRGKKRSLKWENFISLRHNEVEVFNTTVGANNVMLPRLSTL